MFMHLRAYTCIVFTDFRQVEDDSSRLYRQLCDMLHGEGVPSIEDSMQEILLKAILQPLSEILNTGYLNYLNNQILKPSSDVTEVLKIKEEARVKMQYLVNGAASLHPSSILMDDVVNETARLIEMILVLSGRPPGKSAPGYEIRLKMSKALHENTGLRMASIIFAYIAQLGKIIDPEDVRNNSISLFDEWKTGRYVENAVSGLGLTEQEVIRVVKMVRVMISMQKWIDDPDNQDPAAFLQSTLVNPDIQLLLQMNRYQDILYYSKEGFDDFLSCLMASVVLEPDSTDPTIQYERILVARDMLASLQKASDWSDYQVEKLLQAFEEPSVQKL
jgi:hypothetical protein